MARCDLVRRLPVCQRSAAVADAMAGLWLAAGTSFSQQCFDKASSATFSAIVGETKATQGRLLRRSRAITHLVGGPGPHVSLLPVAALLSWARQWTRMFHAGWWTEQRLEELWTARGLAAAGPLRRAADALKWLGVGWSEPLRWTLQAGDQERSVSLVFSFEGMNDIASTSERCHHAAVRNMLHNVRAFLRHAVAAREVRRRPKNFGGLELGWCEHEQVRHATYAMRLVFGGPALLAGGIWIGTDIHLLPHRPDELCPRGKEETEHTMHRFWSCSSNLALRHQLDSEVPGNNYPVHLPQCLARCGLAPADLARVGLTVEAVLAIQHYLLQVNALATQALVGNKPRGATRELFEVAPAQPMDVLYRCSLPPCKKQRMAQCLREPVGRDAALAVPQVPQPVPSSRWPSVRHPIIVSFDGSACDMGAGWGVTIALPGADFSIDLCGPVALPGQPYAVGATRCTNNTAELSAAYVALRWIADFATTGVCVQYDSVSAVGVATGQFQPGANLSLALNVRVALEAVKTPIVWQKIAAHTGDILNEQADALAKAGGAGIHRGDWPSWIGKGLSSS